MAFCCDCCMFTYDTIGLLRDHLRNMSSASSSSHTAHAFVCPLCCGCVPSSAAPPPPLGGASGATSFVGARVFADHIDTAHADVSGSIILSEWGDSAQLDSSSSSYYSISATAAGGVKNSCANAVTLHQRTTKDGNFGLTLFRCVHCARPFKRAWDLQRHLRTHTDERPFACDTCGRRFRLRTTLADHRWTHEEADAHASQFQCSACAKRFLSRSALKLHMRTHTGEMPFPCADASCTRMFRTKKLMLTHHRNEHNGVDEQILQQQQHFDEHEMDQKQRPHRSFDHEAKMAFLALANLNRTAGNRRPTISVINQSEQSAFSKFKHYNHHHHHQQQHHLQRASLQRPNQANNVQQRQSDIMLIGQPPTVAPPVAGGGSTSLPPAAAAVVHQRQLQQQHSLSTPTIGGSGSNGTTIMITTGSNNGTGINCWPPPPPAPIKFNNDNHHSATTTPMQQHQHHLHH